MQAPRASLYRPPCRQRGSRCLDPIRSCRCVSRMCRESVQNWSMTLRGVEHLEWPDSAPRRRCCEMLETVVGCLRGLLVRLSWVQVPPPEPKNPLVHAGFRGFVGECRDGLGLGVSRMCRNYWNLTPTNSCCGIDTDLPGPNKERYTYRFHTNRLRADRRGITQS